MTNGKKTVIVGATPNTSRYAYLAATMLSEAGHEFVPLGIRRGVVHGRPILDLRLRPPIHDVHTLTMYINPTNQKEWEDYLLELAPERIIFNPGTENAQLHQKAYDAGIEVLHACTLVLLSTKQY